MTWLELRPETRQVPLDAIDRLKAAHEAQDSAVALIQKMLMALEGDG
jgi:hypothetical protein